jgi:hydrogenase-4 component B
MSKRPSIFFFALLIISGILAIWAGLETLITKQEFNYQIVSCFPNLIWQFHLDPLSGFFLAIIGIIVISVAFYGPDNLALMSFFTIIFIGSMYLVVLAYNIFSFMFFWELMTISSYFLVAYQHEQASNRKAALIYLLMSQISAFLILFAFGILNRFIDSMSFVDLQTINIPSKWANLAFILAFFGFGTKAGIVPLHIWLPQAHPVVPSHISALMSGVMIKIAIYGFIRFTFNLLGIANVNWQEGSLVLFFGIVSALIGVLYALMQHDLKRLLAYHSVENMGIIFIGLGLSLIFISTAHPILAALGLIAALYHCLNHAIFKSLLFLGAGIILQQSKEHDLENMGGLIKTMPYTAWCFLIGCISISALPPLNGFVSEWLIFQTAFQAFSLSNETMRALIPVVASLLALTGALAAACFVKVYAVAFLGQSRSKQSKLEIRDPAFGARFSLGLLAMLCIFFGILPNVTINILNTITSLLIGASLSNINTSNWLWLIPISVKTSSYNACLIIFEILTSIVISYCLIIVCFGRIKLRRVTPWDCGYGKIDARMQYSATAFAMPIRRIFNPLWSIRESSESQDNQSVYHLQIGDRIWQWLYLPCERLSFYLARGFAKIQGGNVRIYLASVFVTLIILLGVII